MHGIIATVDISICDWMCWLNPEPKLKNLTFTLLYFLIIIEIISIDFVAPLTAGWSPSKLTWGHDCER